ncbi:MAG: TonB-dependent receptor domain-containing protein [Hyphomicrobiales bacterium]
MLKTKLSLSIILLLLVFVKTSYSQNGIIKGTVYNSKTNKTIPFVSIAIWGTSKGTISDSLGNFVLKGLPPGYTRLSASAIGFKPEVTEDILVTNARSSHLDIFMTEQAVQLETVVIKTSPFEKSKESPVSLQTLDISEIERSPGTARDISRVIQNLPGVSSSPGYRNDIIVRGGGANENSFYLEDIEIPNINHFATQGSSGGPNGIINTDFIREAKFYSGAFPSSRGNALSSILELQLIEPNTDKFQYRITGSATEAAISANGPISKKSGLIVSVRRSYLDFLFGLLKLPFIPTYTDAQFKYKIRFNDKNTLTFIGLGALDKLRLNTDIKDPDDNQKYLLKVIPKSNQETYTIGGVYKHFDNRGKTTIVLSRNYLNNGSVKYYNNIEEPSQKTFDYKSDEAETKFRAERSIRMEKYDINYGIGAQYSTFSVNRFARAYKNDMPTTYRYRTNLDLFAWNLFGQIGRSFIDDRLGLSAGFRMDANNYSDQMNNLLDQFSPRFSASYDLSEKWSINFNTGTYYQLPPYTTLGYKLNSGELINKTNKIKYMNVTHLITGISFYPDDKSKISVEGFYKWYKDYPFSVADSVAISSKGGDYGIFGDEEVISNSKGNAYGFELSARDKDIWGFNVNLSYTFVRSQFKDINEKLIPSKWDNKHIINLTVLKPLPKDWEVGVRWRYVGGAPYTPYDLEKSSRVLAWNAQNEPYLNYGAFNTLRLPSFHQLDIRIDKHWFMKDWSMILFVDIQNLYNFKYLSPDLYTNTNTDDIPVIINPQDPIEEQRYQLRAIKNESGTIIPTVGVIVEF